MRVVRIVFVVLVGTSIATGAFVVWAPTDVEIRTTADVLVVRARMGMWGEPRRVPLQAIQRVEAVELGAGWRVRGTGRPDYCEGVFYYRTIGEVWQATRCGHRVVLVAHSEQPRPILLEPADPDALVDAIRNREPGVHANAEPRDSPWWWTATRILLLMMIPAFVFFASRGNILYVVDGSRLRIRGPLGWHGFDLIGRRAYRHSPQRLWRTFGAGLPGYWVGYFRGDGKALRVWATRRTDGVVLEGEPRVWITPRDPEAFLQAAAGAGAILDPPGGAS